MIPLEESVKAKFTAIEIAQMYHSPNLALDIYGHPAGMNTVLF